MKKVAVFGKPGSGKSVLSKKLASTLDVPLHPLDTLVFAPNGEPLTREALQSSHDDMLATPSWVIEGLGPLGLFQQRLEAADTLIYIDLPYLTSYWFVTKRLLKSLFVHPEGWPEGSNVLKGTLQSYRFLKLSPTFWNAEFAERLEELSKTKQVHVIKNAAQLDRFVENIVKQGR
ncbi:adenylate kinase [Vibrio mexicanus]|uniref:adenylate kinase n=1 Tax=Vibrio mexicanus TaxID=1004326 RepID=UPI00063CA724|nr:adenylate kinase [Vibrio mexicanus]